jgi:hypothetical protein
MWAPPSLRELRQIDGSEGKVEERVGLPQTSPPIVTTVRRRAARCLVAAPEALPSHLCFLGSRPSFDLVQVTKTLCRCFFENVGARPSCHMPRATGAGRADVATAAIDTCPNLTAHHRASQCSQVPQAQTAQTHHSAAFDSLLIIGIDTPGIKHSMWKYSWK